MLIGLLVTGTDSSDTLTGGGGADTLRGLEGSDWLRGEAGDDLLEGGGGDDNLDGGFGADTLLGGEGNDYLRDDAGENVLSGGAGDDLVQSYSPYAKLAIAEGGDGNDTIGAMASQLDGRIIVDAGAGDDDVYLYVADRAEVTLGAGRDTLSMDALRIRDIVVHDFQAGVDGDRLDLSPLLQPAYIPGYDGANPFGLGHLRLVQSGDDTLIQFSRNSGADQLDASYTTIVTLQHVTASTLTSDNFRPAFSPDGSPMPGELQEGTDSSDTLTGGGGADTLRGLEGSDWLRGEAGDDLLEGGGGGDNLDGGFGADTLLGGEGNDYLRDDAGENVLSGGAGDDLVQSYSPYAKLAIAEGGDGNDTIGAMASQLDGRIIVDAGAGDDDVYLYVADRAEVTLGAGRDTLSMDALRIRDIVVHDFQAGVDGDRLDLSPLLQPAYIPGYDGANPFGLGHLRLVQSGDDTLIQFSRNSGADQLDASYTTIVTLQHVTASTLTSDNFRPAFSPDGSPMPGELQEGTDSSDTLTGGGGADTLRGLEGSDWLRGEAGDDLLEGGGGGDNLDGGFGADTLLGGEGNDYLRDDAGENVLSGGAGDDLVQSYSPYAKLAIAEGGDGNDTIGAMASQLDGRIIVDAGAGDDDVYLYVADRAEVTLGAGRDTLSMDALRIRDIVVHDFQAGVDGDRLDLSPLLQPAYIPGYDGANPFGLGHLRLVQSGDDTLIQFSRNSGADQLDASYTTIVTLQHVTASTLTSDNFRPMFGTPGDDHLIGSDQAEVLDGVGGDDLANGGGGDDTVLGGAGNDTLIGGDGQDSLVGGVGVDAVDYSESTDPVSVNLDTGLAVDEHGALDHLSELENIIGGGAGDVLSGDSGANLVMGGGGNDNISGGLGNDDLDGGDGDDMLYAGSGDDVVYGGAGADFIIGGDGEGNDLYDGGGGSDTVKYTSSGAPIVVDLANGFASGKDIGDDTLRGVEHIIGGRGSDVIRGSGVANTLHGDSGDDHLLGLGYDDTLDGGTGADLLIGGTGNDTYYVDDAGDVVVERSGEGTDRVYVSADWTVSANVNRVDLTTAVTLTGNAQDNLVYGSTGADHMLGLGGDDKFYGGAGSDTLEGGTGKDMLDGGTGADLLIGGTGNDTYYVDDAGDVVVERSGEGTDRVYVSADWTVSANVNRVDLTTAVTLTGNAQDNLVYGSTGADHMLGLGGDDKFYGGVGSDTLEGGTGKDMLDGGTGADLLIGGTGNDTYYVDDAGDVVVERSGEGTDRVYVSADWTVSANVNRVDLTTAVTLTGNAQDNLVYGSTGADHMLGLGGDDKFYGGAGSDTLEGGTGKDMLDGGTGADLLIGGTGNDTYYVDDAGDVVVERSGEGTDRVYVSADWTVSANVNRVDLTTAVTLTGNAQDNLVYGSTGADHMLGLGGDDKFYGGAGSDTLEGGTGKDMLDGGTGADTFRYAAASEGGDTISEFVSGEDAIEILVMGFEGRLTSGVLTAAQFTSNTTGRANSAMGVGQFVYETDAGKLWWDVDGVGGQGGTVIVTLTGHPALVASDIHLVG
ncbi:calcium-binding protein [Roseomonas sp. WA12]